jgi:copper transport protein
VLLAGCLLPSRRTAELAEALPRFSRLALGSVTVLVVTGTYQAWREVWPVPALWSTGYGQLLLAKVAVVALIVAVAWFSRAAVRRRYVTPVVHALSVAADEDRTGPGDGDGSGDDDDARLRQRLRRSVGIEVALAAGVLALASVLVSTAPARATYVAPVDRTVQLASGGSVQVEVTPAKVGANTVRVTVLDAQGAPKDATEVTATLALPGEQIGPLPVALTKAGTGEYATTSASLSRAGTWELVLRVRMSEFDRDVAQVDVPVR